MGSLPQQAQRAVSRGQPSIHRGQPAVLRRLSSRQRRRRSPRSLQPGARRQRQSDASAGRPAARCLGSGFVGAGAGRRGGAADAAHPH
jgi:hypothetical protein